MMEVGMVSSANGAAQTAKSMATDGGQNLSAQLQPRAEEIDLFQLLLSQGNTLSSFSNPNELAGRVLESLRSMREDYAGFMSEAEQQLKPGPAGGATLDLQGGGPLDAGPASAIQRSASTEQAPAIADARQFELEIQELLWLQLNMGRVMANEQILSKVAGRSTTNFDMLLRGQ